MKKFFVLALAVLPLLFACNKGGSNVTQEENLRLPRWAQHAAKVVFGNAVDVNISGTKATTTFSIKEAQFFRSGRFLLSSATTKGDAPEYLYGSFTYDEATTTYILTIGTTTIKFKMNGESGQNQTVGVSVKEGNKEEQVVVASEPVTVTESNPEESTELENKVFRTWKIADKGLYIKIPSMSIEAKVSNLSNVVSKFPSSVNISDAVKQSIQNHNIAEITLGEGIVTVAFENAPNFVGAIDIKGNSSIHYDFNAFTSAGISVPENLFKASADISIRFESEKAILSLSVDSGVEEIGTGLAEITLEPKE